MIQACAVSSRAVCAARDDANFRQQIAHCGFQPAETEVLRALHAARQIKTVWVAAASALLNFRTPGVTESKHLCHFIEGLARSVVHRAADYVVIRKRVHTSQHGVSAAYNQRNVCPDLLVAICVIEKGREQMPLEMVDREIRLAKADR